MAAAAKRKRPVGVLVLALIQIISGIQLLGGALWAFAVAGLAGTPEGQELLAEATSPWVAENAAALFLLLGLALLVLSLFSFLLARGYVRGMERARVRGRKVAVYAILFAVLGILLVPNRTDPGSPWWTILFNLAIYLYLNSDRVRRYFRSG
jgi:hypothetical protein